MKVQAPVWCRNFGNAGKKARGRVREGGRDGRKQDYGSNQNGPALKVVPRRRADLHSERRQIFHQDCNTAGRVSCAS